MGMAYHQLGADGPQGTLFGYTRCCFLWAAAQAGRVCRTWHRTYGVQVPVPGVSAAEGEEQGQGVTARWGLEAAPSTDGGRRTGPGSEGWSTRDERARDREVLQARGVGLIPPASTQRKFWVLLREVCMASRSQVWMTSCGTAGKPGGNRDPNPPPEATPRTERGELPADRHAAVSRGPRRHARAC
jgi:hypothetical protein